ncbi:MAG: hypothetical protein RL261_959 [Pseudomonadota bacterium]
MLALLVAAFFAVPFAVRADAVDGFLEGQLKRHLNDKGDVADFSAEPVD